MWKLLSQGSNPSHGNESRCTDNAETLRILNPLPPQENSKTFIIIYSSNLPGLWYYLEGSMKQVAEPILRVEFLIQRPEVENL